MSLCHFTVVPESKRKNKEEGGGTAEGSKWIISGLYLHRNAENVTCLCIFWKHKGWPDSTFSIFKWAYCNCGSLWHGNASALTLHSSVSLLDDILACVSSLPDSNTAFPSAASLEMHISLLVLPVHDRTGSIDRTRLLIDSWAEWKRSKILFGRHCWDELCPEDSCRGCENYSWKIHWLNYREILLRGNVDNTTVISVIVCDIRDWASPRFRPD